MSRISSFSEWLLRQPLIWGGLASLGYYACIRQGVITSPLVIRYTASHQVEYITVVLFFVGLAALLLRLMGLTAQFATFGRDLIEPIPRGGQPVHEAGRLMANLALLPEMLQKSYLVARLREALQYIDRKESADDLDEHLHHLEEVDAIRMSGDYAMVRIVIWAIPILGFLGTVIGITMAIASLSPEALENSLPEVTGKLGLAFDTTALALALSMMLMFVKFCAERLEDQLLARVDARVSAELVGRFHVTAGGNDPNVAVIRNMSQQVIEAVEALASRQAQVWKSSIDQTHEQWAEITSAAAEVLENSFTTAISKSYERHAETLNQGAARHSEQLSASAQAHNQHLCEGLEKLAELLVESLEKHGQSLTTSERELATENRRHLSEVEAALGESMVLAADRQEKLIAKSETMLKQMQDALLETAGATVEQQQQLIKQGDVLLRVVDATGQVTRLEDTLNENLSALRQASNFEEAMLSLSSAIGLLSARMKSTGQQPAAREFKLDEHTGSAA